VACDVSGDIAAKQQSRRRYVANGFAFVPIRAEEVTTATLGVGPTPERSSCPTVGKHTPRSSIGISLFDQRPHAAAHCFCLNHKAARLAFQCLHLVGVGPCWRKLHRLAAARASRALAVSRIARIGGEIIPGTAEWVAPSNVDAEARVREAAMAQAMKEQRTAQELADMIAVRIGVGGVFVAVHKDPAYGWHPTVVTAADSRTPMPTDGGRNCARTSYQIRLEGLVRRFVIRRAPAAGAPRAFRRQCFCGTGAPARRTARSAGTSGTTVPE
jgi:hypothetical protein